MNSAVRTVAVFGVTGLTGKWVSAHVLDTDHTLSVLVRDPARLAGDRSADAARITTGNVLDASDVAATVEDTTAIISALGADDFRTPGDTLAVGMRNIVAAAKRHGVRRIIAMAGGGILDSPNGGLRSEQPGFPKVFAAITLAHQGTWHALRDSGLDWTLVCTPDLTDEPATGTVRALADTMPENPKAISRDDVARFMVEQLERTEFIGRRVGLCT